MAPYVRTVKTASGATAVQVVYSSRRGSRDIEHIGSAHDDVELELLKAAARQRMAAGQGELDLGLDAEPAEAVDRGGGPLAITSSQMGHLWDTLVRGFEVLGFDEAAGFDGPAVARVRRIIVAEDARGGLCCPYRPGAGEPGAVRRVDVVLRDRRR